MYQAFLRRLPTKLKEDEVRAVIALTPSQVVSGLCNKTSLKELEREGASVLGPSASIPEDIRLYPVGSAVAIAQVLRHAGRVDWMQAALFLTSKPHV